MRQFVNPGLGRVVSCEWDARHGAWCCTSEEARFNLCSSSLVTFYDELRRAGFEEAEQVAAGPPWQGG